MNCLWYFSLKFRQSDFSLFLMKCYSTFWPPLNNSTFIQLASVFVSVCLFVCLFVCLRFCFFRTIFILADKNKNKRPTPKHASKIARILVSEGISMNSIAFLINYWLFCFRVSLIFPNSIMKLQCHSILNLNFVFENFFASTWFHHLILTEKFFEFWNLIGLGIKNQT